MANFLLKNRKNRFFHVTKIFLEFFNIFFWNLRMELPPKNSFHTFLSGESRKNADGTGAAEPCQNYLKSIFDHFLD